MPSELASCWVVFISNNSLAVPLWNQKQAKSVDQPVVWDYHVILLHRQSSSVVQVYDLDTRLTFPCSFRRYAQQAIHSEDFLKPEYKRYFRVISAETYLRHFASDRTHMLGEDGSWQKTPPPYPCIQTPESNNNIADFISMDPSVGWGTVLSHGEFTRRFLPS
ncbi:protein N-terminal glutamine amidohydrolase-like isoform X2 [Liolophura sinensis]|uniref:protein N-terminal glutamine amidohydrolase-like isoform X2 n=1 Tax=Liolophura sinensis TaxID=3198878 RepID=UPI003158F800